MYVTVGPSTDRLFHYCLLLSSVWNALPDYARVPILFVETYEYSFFLALY